MNQPMYEKQPPKDFKATMDYKQRSIERAQRSKEDAIRIQSSGRDAVLIVTTMYPELREALPSPNKLSLKQEAIMEQILNWRKWLYENIYSDDIYKETHEPF